MTADRSVPAPFRLGLELPPLIPSGATGPGTPIRDLHRLVSTAEEAGFGAVWLSSGVAGQPPLIDAVAAGASETRRTSRVALGVVTDLRTGRNPSVLAREATTLDILSSGRGAVLLEGGSASPSSLVEAATVCRLLFTREVSDFDGRDYGVAGAVNRPPPVHRSGPPIAVDFSRPAGSGEALGRAGVAAALSGAVGSIDAVAARSELGELSMLRAALDELEETVREPSQSADSAPAVPITLLWRASIPPDARAGAARVEEARAAGAGGVLCRLGRSVPTVDEVEALGEVLRPLWA